MRDILKISTTVLPFAVASLVPLILIPWISRHVASEVMVEYFNFEVYSGLFLIVSDLGLVQKSLSALLRNNDRATLVRINGHILFRIVLLVLFAPLVYVLVDDSIVVYSLLNTIFVLALSPWLYHYIGRYYLYALVPVILKIFLLLSCLIDGNFYYLEYLVFAIAMSCYIFFHRVNFIRIFPSAGISKDNIKISLADMLVWIYSSSPILLLQSFQLPATEIVSFGLATKLAKSVKAALRPLIAAFLDRLSFKRSLKTTITAVLFLVLAYVLCELVILQPLSLLIFGGIDGGLWLMRFTIYLTITGSLNVIVGFGISTVKENFTIKLRQAVVGLSFYMLFIFFSYDVLSAQLMLAVLICVEILILFDYAKKNITLGWFNAQRT